ncbi:hypothetical protein KIK84_13490 [Curvibacter sp. CHRR-16]|uniref:hypothetical protein n=1 Tax=Curvibacter sp. CHRR-16 TaxID=2835872 RepID=UPI001BDB2647|nr:hypothetical protein [Curvibacter sp. CHRR-16]MBT0571342.1 hypothetical protein [Curvibacter sp. CHRR-16]
MNSHPHDHHAHPHHTHAEHHHPVAASWLERAQDWLQSQSFLALASWQRVLLICPVLALLWLGVWWAMAWVNPDMGHASEAGVTP